MSSSSNQNGQHRRLTDEEIQLINEGNQELAIKIIATFGIKPPTDEEGNIILYDEDDLPPLIPIPSNNNS